MATDDDTDSMDTCSPRQECTKQEASDDGTAPTSSAPTTSSTAPSAAAPSAERRRRRRLEQTVDAAPSTRYSRGRRDGIDYFNDYYNGPSKSGGWMDRSTAGMVGLLFFVLILQKDKLINDIRQSKTRGLPNAPILRQFPTLYIIANRILLSPIDYIKTLTLEIFTLLLRGVTHPLHLPSVVWELVCLLAEEGRMGIDQLYSSIFGFAGSTSSERRERVMGAASGSESLPELEKEERTFSAAEGKERRKSPSRAGVDEIAKVKIIRYESSDLPPAFVLDSQYPSGWLVYHSKYGVISREKMMQLDGNG